MSARLRLAAATAGVAVLLSPFAAPAQADDAIPAGREYAGITSSVTGLTVVLDDRTVTPTVLDYDHPVLTVTGRVRLYQPATDTYLPTSGGTVWLFMGQRDTAPVAADGTFSVSVRAAVTVAGFTPKATLLWTPDAATQEAFGQVRSWPASIISWPVPVLPTSLRFVPDQSAVTVKVGAAATLSGVLQRKAGDGWQPVPGADLDVYGALAAGTDGIARLSGTTDAYGRVSFRVPFGRDGVGTVRLSDPGMLFAPDRAFDLAEVPVDAIPTSSLRWTDHAIDRNGYLDVGGTISTDLSSMHEQRVTIRLQESRDGKTAWSTVGTTTAWLAEDETYTGSGTFWDRLFVRHPSWYFRLSFAGTSSVQGSTSATIRTTRRESRIVRFSVSPRTVDRLDTVVLRGVLQRHTSTGWARFGKRAKVYAVFLPRYRNPNKLEYRYVPGTWTKTTGAFAIRMEAREDGWWFVKWFSNERHLVGTESARLYVNVR